MTDFDVAVVGSGIAGAVSACAAATRGLRVVLLEREDVPAMHSTGRSAASLDPTAGSPVVRALTRASLPYFTADQDAASERHVLRARPFMLVAEAGAASRLRDLASDLISDGCDAELLTSSEARARCSVLRPDTTDSALLISDAYDLDADRLFETFLARARLAGAAIRRGFEVDAIEQCRSGWEICGPAHVTVRTVVNAAGAWADSIAAMAGIEPLGLRPLRRTALVVAGPTGCEGWPLVASYPETFYLKPWGRSQLLLSPADERPDEPGDARPQELDVARCIDRVNAATTLSIRHVRSLWAGHRTFASDRVPVVGFDPTAEGFFWCAGLGGTGIQNAPAIGELVGALLAGDPPPAETAPLARDLSPGRFRRLTPAASVERSSQDVVAEYNGPGPADRRQRSCA